MGFANWNTFACDYNDTVIRQTADALVSSGLARAGYDTIIIQECIVPAGARNGSGVLQPDPHKFPHGIADVVDYIHGRGLKAGIYTDVGPLTCAGYEGSYGHEAVDAATFAAWGLDFVEEDSCHHNASMPPYRELYARMRDALLGTERPIEFYMCVQGQDDVYQWGRDTGNLWRTTGDICPGGGPAQFSRVLRNWHGTLQWPNATSPGGWQDADMLVVGMAELTPLQWQSHFSLWCMLASPLWLGMDVRSIGDDALSIVSNAEAIAINQDPRGLMCRPAGASTGAYYKPLAPRQQNATSVAVVLMNEADATATLSVAWSDIGLADGAASVRDVWAHAELGAFENGWNATLAADEAALVVVTQQW